MTKVEFARPTKLKPLRDKLPSRLSEFVEPLFPSLPSGSASLAVASSLLVGASGNLSNADVFPLGSH
jgi:hypothetical protein